MPSIANAELFGLNLISSVGFPAKSTYCVAICPFSANFAISSSEAINLTSPWEIGTVYTSSGCVFISHGDLFDAILVLTILD